MSATTTGMSTTTTAAVEATSTAAMITTTTGRGATAVIAATSRCAGMASRRTIASAVTTIISCTRTRLAAKAATSCTARYASAISAIGAYAATGKLRWRMSIEARTTRPSIKACISTVIGSTPETIAEVAIRAVIEEASAIPVAAIKSGTEVAKAVIDAAIVADRPTP